MTMLAASREETHADRINELHREIEQHLPQEALKARAAGELLCDMKKTVRHGAWLTWLEANFAGSRQTAESYMRLADRWEHITSKSVHAPFLSVREVLELARYGA